MDDKAWGSSYIPTAKEWMAKVDELVAKILDMVCYNNEEDPLSAQYPQTVEELTKGVQQLGYRDVVHFCESFNSKFVIDRSSGVISLPTAERLRYITELQVLQQQWKPYDPYPNGYDDTPIPAPQPLHEENTNVSPTLNIDEKTMHLLANYNPVPPSLGAGAKRKGDEKEAEPAKKSKIHFKFVYDGKTRRFALARDDEHLIGAVIDRVKSVTASSNVLLYWRDEDSLIVLECGEDMQAAIDFAESTMKPPACVVIEATVEKEDKKEKKEEEKKEEVKKEEPPVIVTREESSNAYNGKAFACYECGCYLGPANGGRYACMICAYYNICAACVAKGVHDEHALMRILSGDTMVPGKFHHDPVRAKDSLHCAPRFLAVSLENSRNKVVRKSTGKNMKEKKNKQNLAATESSAAKKTTTSRRERRRCDSGARDAEKRTETQCFQETTKKITIVEQQEDEVKGHLLVEHVENLQISSDLPQLQKQEFKEPEHLVALKMDSPLSSDDDLEKVSKASTDGSDIEIINMLEEDYAALISSTSTLMSSSLNSDFAQLKLQPVRADAPEETIAKEHEADAPEQLSDNDKPAVAADSDSPDAEEETSNSVYFDAAEIKDQDEGDSEDDYCYGKDDETVERDVESENDDIRWPEDDVREIPAFMEHGLLSTLHRCSRDCQIPYVLGEYWTHAGRGSSQYYPSAFFSSNARTEKDTINKILNDVTKRLFTMKKIADHAQPERRRAMIQNRICELSAQIEDKKSDKFYKTVSDQLNEAIILNKWKTTSTPIDSLNRGWHFVSNKAKGFMAKTSLPILRPVFPQQMSLDEHLRRANAFLEEHFPSPPATRSANGVYIPNVRPQYMRGSRKEREADHDAYMAGLRAQMDELRNQQRKLFSDLDYTDIFKDEDRMIKAYRARRHTEE